MPPRAAEAGDMHALSGGNALVAVPLRSPDPRDEPVANRTVRPQNPVVAVPCLVAGSYHMTDRAFRHAGCLVYTQAQPGVHEGSALPLADTGFLVLGILSNRGRICIGNAAEMGHEIRPWLRFCCQRVGRHLLCVADSYPDPGEGGLAPSASPMPTTGSAPPWKVPLEPVSYGMAGLGRA